MDNEYDFDLDLDIDTSIDLTPPAAAPAATPSKAPKAPKVKKPHKGGLPKWLLAVIIVVVVAAAGFFGVRAISGGGGVSLGGGSPLQKTMKGLAANESVAFLRDVAKNGSLQAELGLKKIAGVDGTVTVGVKTDATDTKNPRAAVDAALALKKKNIADVSLYADMEQVVLSSDAFLPGKGLGVNVKKLGKNLDGSIFDPDSDSYFAMDEETFAALKDAVSGEPTADVEKLVKQAQKVYESGYKVISKSINANAEKTKAAETLSFGDKEVKVNAVTYTADAEDIYNITLAALKWAQDSKELKTLLDMVVSTYPDMAEEMDLEDEFEEFFEDLKDRIEEMEEDPEDFIDDLDDTEVVVTIYISKSKGEILGLKLKSGTKGDGLKAEATWGPSMAELSSISFKFDNGYRKYTGSYTVTANDKQSFESSLKIKRNSNAAFSGSFKWNKQDGSYTLKAEDLTVKGTLEKLSDGFKATVSKVSVYGGEQKLDLTVTVTKSAKLGSAPAYKEVVTMSEDDFEELGEDLLEAVSELVDKNEDLEDALYNLFPQLYWMLQYYG